METAEKIFINAYTPQPKQLQFQKAKQRYKLFGGSMGGGKSRTLCEEINRQMIIYPGNRGLILRATLADFKISTYLTLTEETLKPFIDAGIIVENKTEKYFDYLLPQGKSRLYYGGLDMDAKTKDKYFSTEYGCIGIDEAREVTEDHFKKLGTRLRHKLPNGKVPEYFMLLASNPAQNWLKTYFILVANPEKYLFVPALPKENKYNPPDYEEQIRDLFHGDEAFIKAYLEGSWDAIASIDDLILMQDLAPLIGKAIVDPHGQERRLTAIDPARLGDDMTQIYDFLNAQVVDSETYGKKETMENVGRITRHIVKNFSELIGVDVGYNPGVADILRGDYDYNVSEIDFASISGDARFGNKRAEIYWNAREMTKEAQCSIPSDIELQGQLCAIKYKFKGGKFGTKIFIESKEDIKKRLGKSPDKADAFVIGLWCLRECPITQEPKKETWRTRYKEEHSYAGSGSGMAA